MKKCSADIWVREIIAGKAVIDSAEKQTAQTKSQLFKRKNCYQLTNKSTIL